MKRYEAAAQESVIAHATSQYAVAIGVLNNKLAKSLLIAAGFS
jgi:hypothetical protein